MYFPDKYLFFPAFIELQAIKEVCDCQSVAQYRYFILNEREREAFPSDGWWLVLGQFYMSPSDEKDKAM